MPNQIKTNWFLYAYPLKNISHCSGNPLISQSKLGSLYINRYKLLKWDNNLQFNEHSLETERVIIFIVQKKGSVAFVTIQPHFSFSASV